MAIGVVVALVLLLVVVVVGSMGTGTGDDSAGANVSSFSIEGSWKNVGQDTYGQIMQGSIVSFDGTHCNVVSPADTYALVRQGDTLRLECTTFMFSDTLSFGVNVIDQDDIVLTNGDKAIRLERVG